MKKTSYIIIILVLLVISTSVTLPMWNSTWVSPLAMVFKPKVIIIPSPTPSPKPKTFKFDSSTDLKAELETINPEVLDSDFEQ